MAYISGLIICAVIAYYFGRKRQIGALWAFLLLGAGLIPGIIAIYFSPDIDEPVKKGTAWHIGIGIVLILVGIINLLFITENFDPFLLGSTISIIIIGAYLAYLGRREPIKDYKTQEISLSKEKDLINTELILTPINESFGQIKTNIIDKDNDLETLKVCLIYFNPHCR